jgi:hypothetical protein
VLGAFLRFGEQGGTSFWAHIGGFLAGAAMSFAFKAPDLQQVKLGHEVLDRMNDRGPAATAFAAEMHLKKHPQDLKAMWELADSQEVQGEKDKASQALLRIFEAGSPEDRLHSLKRLCALQATPLLPTLKRLQAADQYRSEAPEISRALLESVLDDPKAADQRPDVMLSLASLERETNVERANTLIEGLASEYPLHPATELARKRGWIS